MLFGRLALFPLFSLAIWNCVAVAPPPEEPAAVSTAAPLSRAALPAVIPKPQPTPVSVPDSCLNPDPASAPAAPIGLEEIVRVRPPASVSPLPQYKPLAFETDVALEAQIRTTLGDEAASYGMVIENIKTGRGARVNAEKVFYAASMFKVTYFLSVYNCTESNLGPPKPRQFLDERIPFLDQF